MGRREKTQGLEEIKRTTGLQQQQQQQHEGWAEKRRDTGRETVTEIKRERDR